MSMSWGITNNGAHRGAPCPAAPRLPTRRRSAYFGAARRHPPFLPARPDEAGPSRQPCHLSLPNRSAACLWLPRCGCGLPLGPPRRRSVHPRHRRCVGGATLPPPRRASVAPPSVHAPPPRMPPRAQGSPSPPALLACSARPSTATWALATVPCPGPSSTSEASRHPCLHKRWRGCWAQSPASPAGAWVWAGGQQGSVAMWQACPPPPQHTLPASPSPPARVAPAAAAAATMQDPAHPVARWLPAPLPLGAAGRLAAGAEQRGRAVDRARQPSHAGAGGILAGSGTAGVQVQFSVGAATLVRGKCGGGSLLRAVSPEGEGGLRSPCCSWVC